MAPGKQVLRALETIMIYTANYDKRIRRKHVPTTKRYKMNEVKKVVTVLKQRTVKTE